MIDDDDSPLRQFRVYTGGATFLMRSFCLFVCFENITYHKHRHITAQSGKASFFNTSA